MDAKVTAAETCVRRWSAFLAAMDRVNWKLFDSSPIFGSPARSATCEHIIAQLIARDNRESFCHEEECVIFSDGSYYHWEKQKPYAYMAVPGIAIQMSNVRTANWDGFQWHIEIDVEAKDPSSLFPWDEDIYAALLKFAAKPEFPKKQICWLAAYLFQCSLRGDSPPINIWPLLGAQKRINVQAAFNKLVAEKLALSETSL